MFKIHRRAKERVRLIVGLGNPSDEYKDTFHNVGFAFIDYLAGQRGQKMESYRDFAFLRSDSLIAVKPLGFMNRSGEPVKRALKYFGAEAKDLIVVHDDSDLKLGQYKNSFGRGSAGHKGVESIFKELGTDKFERIRIGIRKSYKTQGEHRKAGDFVLKKMGGEDRKNLEKIFLEIIVSHPKS